MCLSPKIPKPDPPPPVPMKEDAKVAADNLLKKRASAKGYSSTILTAPLGASQTSGAVAAKSLLGG